MVQALWKTAWRYLRKLYIELPYDSVIPLLGIYSDKTFLKKDMHLHVHCSTSHNSQQTKCPSIDDWIRKSWYIYTMEYYSAIKKNEIMPFAATWMERETLILSERSQSERERPMPCDATDIWSLIYGTDEPVYRKETNS